MDLALEHGYDITPNWINAEESLYLNNNNSSNNTNINTNFNFDINNSVITAAASAGVILIGRFLAVKPQTEHSFNSQQNTSLHRNNSNNSTYDIIHNNKSVLQPKPMQVGCPPKNIHLQRLVGSVHNTGIFIVSIYIYVI